MSSDDEGDLPETSAPFAALDDMPAQQSAEQPQNVGSDVSLSVVASVEANSSPAQLHVTPANANNHLFESQGDGSASAVAVADIQSPFFPLSPPSIASEAAETVRSDVNNFGAEALLIPATPTKSLAVDVRSQNTLEADRSPSEVAAEHLLDADYSIMLDSQCLQPNRSGEQQRAGDLLLSALVEEDEEEGGQKTEAEHATLAVTSAASLDRFSPEADRTLHLAMLETLANREGELEREFLDAARPVSNGEYSAPEHPSIATSAGDVLHPDSALPCPAASLFGEQAKSVPASSRKNLDVEVAIQREAAAASPCPVVEEAQYSTPAEDTSVEIGRCDSVAGNLSAMDLPDVMEVDSVDDVAAVQMAEEGLAANFPLPNSEADIANEVAAAQMTADADVLAETVALPPSHLPSQHSQEIGGGIQDMTTDAGDGHLAPTGGQAIETNQAFPNMEASHYIEAGPLTIADERGSADIEETTTDLAPTTADPNMPSPTVSAHAQRELADLAMQEAITAPSTTPIKAAHRAEADGQSDESLENASMEAAFEAAATTKRRTLNRGGRSQRAATESTAIMASLLDDAELKPTRGSGRAVRRSGRASIRSASSESLASEVTRAQQLEAAPPVPKTDKGKKRAAPAAVQEDQPVRKAGRPRKVPADGRERTPEAQIKKIEEPKEMPARRQSRRVAAVSGLPQPKTRGAQGAANVAPADTQPGTASVGSASNGAALGMRPRPAQNSQPLPSPRRVPSPEKKRSKLGAPAQPQTPTVVATSRIQLSPRRVPSPIKGHPHNAVAGAASGKPDRVWPVQPNGPAPPRQIFGSQFSPDAARRVSAQLVVRIDPRFDYVSIQVAKAVFPAGRDTTKASSIFSAKASWGLGSVGLQPSSSQAGAVSAVSPIKGLAHRCGAPASPVLLELALDPEALVLAPRSPQLKPIKPESPSFANADGPQSLLKRDLSLPPAAAAQAGSSAAQATFGSSRRAFSAQPAASPRRAELPSPRRVMSKGQPAFALRATGTGTPRVAESSAKPPLSPRRVLILPLPGQRTPHAATAARSITLVDRADAKAAPGATKPGNRPLRVSARKPAVGIAPPASSLAGPSTKPAATGLNPTQLAALTVKHTTLNKRHYNIHNVTVVHKDEDRPPSPTSKIRKIIEGSSSSPKFAKALLASSGSEKSVSCGGEMHADIVTASGKRPHFMAAGDDSPFKSPVKRSLDEEDSEVRQSKRCKSVKWDRGLLQPTSDVRTPRRAKEKAATLARSKKVYKVSSLTSRRDHQAESRCSHPMCWMLTGTCRRARLPSHPSRRGCRCQSAK